jgi:hypothetical protein
MTGNNLWAEPASKNFFLTTWKTGQNGKNGQKRTRVSLGRFVQFDHLSKVIGSKEQ